MFGVFWGRWRSARDMYDSHGLLQLTGLLRLRKRERAASGGNGTTYSDTKCYIDTFMQTVHRAVLRRPRGLVRVLYAAAMATVLEVLGKAGNPGNDQDHRQGGHCYGKRLQCHFTHLKGKPLV